MVKFYSAVILSLFLTAVAVAEVYRIDLSDWPADVVLNIEKEVPEIKGKQLSPEQLNRILKELDLKFRFTSLKLLTGKQSNELRLSGEITPQIESIEFIGLNDLSESEALLIMNLNLKTAIDEDYVRNASEKLAQYYQEDGYRFASVEFYFKNTSAFKRKLFFKVITKKQSKISEVVIENISAEASVGITSRVNASFKNEVLNQETLGKLNLRMRQLLSEGGFYLNQVPAPQLLFSADELKVRAIFKFEKKQRFAVEIENLKQFTIARLEDILKLDTYFSADTNIGAELAEKLKQFYLSEGYPHIETPYFERKETDKIVVTLNLEEGPYVRIRQLQFTGQLSNPSRFYEKKIAELSSIKIRGKYVKEDIEVAVKNLLVFLQNEGFVNARLGLVQVMTDREKLDHGIVNVQIFEGDQVDIGAIEFRGTTKFTADVLKKVMGLEVGQKLSLKVLEEATNKLKVYYASLGYIEFKLVNESTDLIQYSNKNTTANLKFQVDEGPRVEVQSILIEGNQTTHEKVILTEIDFKPGDVLTPAKLEESISRLQRTGHFSSIEILTLESGTNIAARTVIVKVLERDPGVFTVGAGLTNENRGTLHGYTGLAYRNIGGWGRGLSARIEGNYNYADVKFLESKLTVGFVEPYLFETRTRFRINLTRSTTIANYELRKVTELNSATYSLEQDFTSHITGIWDLLNVATYIDRGISVQDQIDNNYNRETLIIVSTGPTLDLDYRNNIFNPTDGSFSRFSIEYAFENGSENIDPFIRATGQTTFYVPIEKSDFVFAQSFRGGYVKDIKSLGFGVPFNKKGFTLGGRTTIRGFDTNEFFPAEDVLGPSFRLKSHATYELVKSELRFPLIQNGNLYGAVFYDGGQVLIDGFSFDDQWRDAIGIGIRYNTPVGPLNLEYAKKLDRKPNEDAEAFHLSIGVF